MHNVIHGNKVRASYTRRVRGLHVRIGYTTRDALVTRCVYTRVFLSSSSSYRDDFFFHRDLRHGLRRHMANELTVIVIDVFDGKNSLKRPSVNATVIMLIVTSC